MSESTKSENGENINGTSVKLEKASTSFLDLLKFVFSEYKLAVYITLIAGIGLIGTNFTGFNVPPILTFAFKAFLIGIIPLTLIGKVLIVDRYMSKRMKRVLAYNPKDGIVPEIIFVPPPIWKNRKSNSLPVRKSNTTDMIDYEVEFCEFDESENQLYVGGINEEIADPVDIIVRNERLNKVYDDLLKSRQKLKRLEGTLKTKKFEMQEANFNAVIEAVEKGTSMDTEKVVDIELDDELEEYKDITSSNSQEESMNKRDSNNEQKNGESGETTLNDLAGVFENGGGNE